MTSTDEDYLRRAIRLAMNGRGLVEPNPMVACVIVKQGQIIGEGYHQKFGEAHAEPNALASCGESPEGATAYVTLEPCCHLNKKTPPCAPRLIAAKVARVVIGCLDPNPDVNGKGVQMLREAGIQVEGPMLEASCKQLIAPFIKLTERRQPYVTLKWAESADRKVAGPHGRREQISNPVASHHVHLLRSRSDAICVGVNTVLHDDPELTPRGVPQLRPIRRLVLDSELRISTASRLVQTAHQVPTQVFCFNNQTHSEKALVLQSLGVVVDDLDPMELNRTDWVGQPRGRRLCLNEMLSVVGGSHLLVEAGPTLAASFFEQSPTGVDRVWIIRSPKRIGDATAPCAAQVPEEFLKTGELNLDGDILTEYLNPKSPAFFSADPSADFVLARDSIG